jgi:hypothetical protein
LVHLQGAIKITKGAVKFRPAIRRNMTKAQQNRLDKLWREKIKARDEYCQVCGTTQNLHAHHVEGRRLRCLRWDADNGILLCAGCHLFKPLSAHNAPAWFMEWFEEKHPERLKKIKIIERLPKNSIYTDYEIMSRKLKEEK